MPHGQAHESAARQRVRMGRALARRQRVAVPLLAPRGGEGHAHEVPRAGHGVAERVQPALGLDQRALGGCEHHAGGAEGQAHHARRHRAGAHRRVGMSERSPE
jgi:hypothetical protein